MNLRELERKIENDSAKLIPEVLKEEIEDSVKALLRDSELPYTINSLRTILVGMKLTHKFRKLSEKSGDDPEGIEKLTMIAIFSLIAKIRDEAEPKNV